MAELRKKQTKKTRLVYPEPDIPLLQAAIKSLSTEITRIEKKIKEQRQESKNTIIGAVVALVFIVVTVAIEVILFHTR